MATASRTVKRFPLLTDEQRAETRRQVEERVRNSTAEQRKAITALRERSRLGRLAQVALPAVRDVVEGRPEGER